MGNSILHRGNSKCKGGEEQVCLDCSRNSEDSSGSEVDIETVVVVG